MTNAESLQTTLSEVKNIKERLVSVRKNIVLVNMKTAILKSRIDGIKKMLNTIEKNKDDLRKDNSVTSAIIKQIQSNRKTALDNVARTGVWA